MNRWTAARFLLPVLAAACTSSVPAPTPVVIPITVGRSSGAETGISSGSPPAKPPPNPGPPTRLPSRLGRNGRDVGDTTIRVLLSANLAAVRIASPGGLVLTDRDGALLAHVSRDETWRVERQSAGHRVRAVRPDGVGTVWTEPPMRARPAGSALLSVADKPYRGELAFYGSDSGVMVVNVLRIDDYLLGVVPLEIGTRAASDSAAVQAQAVAARSYAYTRLSSDPLRAYDLAAGVLDQVYGGAAAETPVSSQAVESTRALVLMYAGRVVNAPYHSTCGGETAAASEVWHSGDDRICEA